MRLVTALVNNLCVCFFRTHSIVYKREGEKRGCSLLLLNPTTRKINTSSSSLRLKFVCRVLSKLQEEQLRLKNGRWYVKIDEHV